VYNTLVCTLADMRVEQKEIMLREPFHLYLMAATLMGSYWSELLYELSRTI